MDNLGLVVYFRYVQAAMHILSKGRTFITWAWGKKFSWTMLSQSSKILCNAWYGVQILESMEQVSRKMFPFYSVINTGF